MTFGTRRDIRAGVLTGGTIALVLSIIAVVVFAASGAEAIEKRSGLTLWHIIAAYVGGGISGGAIVGALMPLSRRKWGPPLLGFLGVLPFAVALTLSLFSSGSWFPPGLVIALLMALLLGAAPAAVADRGDGHN